MSTGATRPRGDHRHTELTCRLVLVRHAAAEGDGRFQGQCDVPLTAGGRRQLGELARKLSRYLIDVAYCSDLLRSRATADFVAQRLGVKLESRPSLREMHFGRWQGLSWRQIVKRFPRFARLWIQRFPHQLIPGAERFEDFEERVGRELREIVAANRDRCVLVVTHAGVIRIALASALGMQHRNLFRLAQDPCAINVIDHFRDGILVRCVNG